MPARNSRRWRPCDLNLGAAQARLRRDGARLPGRLGIAEDARADALDGFRRRRALKASAGGPQRLRKPPGPEDVLEVRDLLDVRPRGGGLHRVLALSIG